jgi:hypothetical protein
MRVNSFTVEGYKNLTQPVTIGPLGAIHALHGANNIGKSNLISAFDLFFALLGMGNHVSKDQYVSLDENEQIAGYPFAQIFNVSNRGPIRWQVELALPEEELRASGVEPECATDPTTISLELTPVTSGAQLRVTQFQMAAMDVARDSAGPTSFAESLRAFIAGTFFGQGVHAARPFALLDPYRADVPGDATVGLVPQQVRDALFDARQSLEGDRRRRWVLFQQLMRALEPELGPGEFETAFDRTTGCANLVYSSGEATFAVDRLGAGVQRLVAAVGTLVLARAPIVGLAEPELGLSPSAQQRFLRAAQALLATPDGPSQLLFTTHSPILGAMEGAFAMHLVDGAPAVEQRSLDGAGIPALDDLPLNGASNGAASGDLDQLIGLVDQLAGMEPEQLVGAAPGARSAGSGGHGGRSAPKPEPAASAPDGEPAWKYQNKS